MTKFLDRDMALSHPFANGHYDHENANEHFILGYESYKEWLENLPEADVVSRDCYDRILWEKDSMKQQLAEIGKKFGEKMDGVRHVVFCSECKHRGWIQEPCHGKSIAYCRILEHPVDLQFYSGAGERSDFDG